MAGLRILIVEDDPLLCALLEKNLQRNGYATRAFRSAEQALAAIEPDPGGFDIAVIDMLLPGMSGEDLARAILSLKADVNIVLTSGRPVDPALVSPGPGARVEVLHKPFLPRDLIGVLAGFPAA